MPNLRTLNQGTVRTNFTSDEVVSVLAVCYFWGGIEALSATEANPALLAGVIGFLWNQFLLAVRSFLQIVKVALRVFSQLVFVVFNTLWVFYHLFVSVSNIFWSKFVIVSVFQEATLLWNTCQKSLYPFLSTIKIYLQQDLKLYYVFVIHLLLGLTTAVFSFFAKLVHSLIPSLKPPCLELRRVADSLKILVPYRVPLPHTTQYGSVWRPIAKRCVIWGWVSVHSLLMVRNVPELRETVTLALVWTFSG